LDSSRQIDRDPDRKPLRVGYISSDFRDHCQSFFTIPLLAHHDRSQFRVFCYCGARRLDAISRRIQGHADEWRNIWGLDDQRAARMIQDDRIDILVELNLHMAGNYLLVLARKPAPVQVTWLGYPGSTGVETIDYRITDPHLDPPGAGESFYSERSIHLPESFWCYDPLTSELAANQLPALTSGLVTFGCLNSFAKVNDRVLELWARVLSVVPGSRLLLICEAPSARKRTLEKLALHGIDSTRIEFSDRLSRQDYLKLYNRIDVALDTFPANGHTTSLDGLWMGVPVVTLPGQTAVSRGGLSIMSNLGLREFVAESEDGFVEIARATSADLRRLAELRLNLRSQMQRSPLMDGPRFARHMEQAYRQMWRRFCVADKLTSA
jgi:predicted O-linked N-acetylglucosamine transferase (SPINDLY family)